MKFKIGDMVWLISLEATKKSVKLDPRGYMIKEFNQWHSYKKVKVLSFSKTYNIVKCEWEDKNGYKSWWYDIDDLRHINKSNPVLIDRWELK